MKTRTIAQSSRSLSLLRISIGIIYFWFGMLKFFHGYSPAEDLAIKTITKLTFGIFNEVIEIRLLAAWETVVGLALMLGKWVKPMLVLLFVHITCTFAPLFLFPGDTFQHIPYGLSLTGQYIIKNLVIAGAALVIWYREKERQQQLQSSDAASNQKLQIEKTNKKVL
ncbi:hypothetical protein [Niastella vici]|uniref:hypothetical protein n=1 Tax=Niastella vici TaxID=1703345 RepID=UPI001C1FF786|nr:hypothetical protein [Niastella vici]